jgi:hypothetical protein
MKDDLCLTTTKPLFSVKVEVVLASEVMEAEVAEMKAVCWIDKGVRRRKMRCGDSHDATALANPVDLRHGRHHIRAMLYDVIVARTSIRKPISSNGRPGDFVKIMDNIGVYGCNAVEIDCAVEMFMTAAQIENCRTPALGVRHSDFAVYLQHWLCHSAPVAVHEACQITGPSIALGSNPVPKMSVGYTSNDVASRTTSRSRVISAKSPK